MTECRMACYAVIKLGDLLVEVGVTARLKHREFHPEPLGLLYFAIVDGDPPTVF